jgi:transcriptional regulator of acetoin/glycerol metabolism
MPRAALIGRVFGDLFDRRLQALFNRPTRQRADLVEMCTHVGLQVMARFEGEGVQDRPRPGSANDGWARPADDRNDRCPLPEPPSRMRDLERQAIERTLASLDGNVSATARQLGISRNTIYRRRS